MKKISWCVFLTLSFLFIFFFYKNDVELWYKGECKFHAGDMYQDYMSCNGNNIINGGYLYHFYIHDELLVVYMNVIYDYPKVCYSNNRYVYVYNYKNRVGKIVSDTDFYKEYHVQLDPKPDLYLRKYSGRCF